MTTNLRQAAQQALEALEWAWGGEPLTGKEMVAIAALRAALAESDDEPVAMRYDFDGYGYRYIDSGSGSNWQTRHKDAEPLYTRPYDQTALELCGVCGWRTMVPGDACLNCERVKPEQPVPLNDGRLTQYPDGSIGVGTHTPQREHITDGSPCWCNPDVIEEEGGSVIVHNYEDNWQQYAKPGETAQQCIERHRSEQDALMKLYATPRKPLTDDEIWKNDEIMSANSGYGASFDTLRDIARAIEAAHGITGEQT